MFWVARLLGILRWRAIIPNALFPVAFIHVVRTCALPACFSSASRSCSSSGRVEYFVTFQLFPLVWKRWSLHPRISTFELQLHGKQATDLNVCCLHRRQPGLSHGRKRSPLFPIVVGFLDSSWAREGLVIIISSTAVAPLQCQIGSEPETNWFGCVGMNVG